MKPIKFGRHLVWKLDTSVKTLVATWFRLKTLEPWDVLTDSSICSSALLRFYRISAKGRTPKL